MNALTADLKNSIDVLTKKWSELDETDGGNARELLRESIQEGQALSVKINSQLMTLDAAGMGASAAALGELWNRTSKPINTAINNANKARKTDRENSRLIINALINSKGVLAALEEIRATL